MTPVQKRAGPRRKSPIVQGLRGLWLRRAARSFVCLARPSTAELGLAGEELASRWLRRRGFRLLGRRLSLPAAEVDIVAGNASGRWVVEVKSGRSSCGLAQGLTRGRWRPADSLDQQQRRRLWRAARMLSRQTGLAHCVLLVEVCFARRGWDTSIQMWPLESPASRRPDAWANAQPWGNPE